jgi:hypothetical protein
MYYEKYHRTEARGAGPICQPCDRPSEERNLFQINPQEPPTWPSQFIELEFGDVMQDIEEATPLCPKLLTEVSRKAI